LSTEEIIEKLAQGNLALRKELNEHGLIKTLPARTEILRPEQYVNVVPVVLSGLLKVYTGNEDKELLLYNIEPGESCIMSFHAAIRNNKSQVYAATEARSTILLLPAARLQEWIRKFPAINQLFYQQFNIRYMDMLDTIRQLVFERLDSRLMRYLQEKKRLSGSALLSISHRQIAQELGTAREVISRMIKKLEREGLVKQTGNRIRILTNSDLRH
jgi:CRP/FNR family transcriptional regulator